MDFGLAAIADQLEANDVRSGTPTYMAPEQLAGKEATKQSDLYALGLVLYELFTGKAAFEAKSIEELMRVRAARRATTPSTLIPDIGPRVERAILHCLEPNPAERPASALEVSASLPGGDPLAEALAAGETPSPEMVAASGPSHSLRLRLATGLLVTIAASLVGALSLTPRSQMLNQLPLEYPPEVLAEKAREIVRAAGYAERAADSTFGFRSDSVRPLLRRRPGRFVGRRAQQVGECVIAVALAAHALVHPQRRPSRACDVGPRNSRTRGA
jgi:serine/threonine-protein kinase